MVPPIRPEKKSGSARRDPPDEAHRATSGYPRPATLEGPVS